MLRDLDLYEEIDFDDVPQGVQILPTKMDFKTKYDSMGTFIKDKARLVVLGNLEWETLQDYFSPTAHSKTLDLLLALAVEHNFILFGLDIYGAFITADIDEPVSVCLSRRVCQPSTALDAFGNSKRLCMDSSGHRALSLTLCLLICSQKAISAPPTTRVYSFEEPRQLKSSSSAFMSMTSL